MRAADVVRPRAPGRRPAQVLPPGSTDCHAHVFGPQARYPMLAKTHFVPHETPFPMYGEMLRHLGLQRAVLVQPSIYGCDNRMIEDSIALARGAGDIDLRAVAVVAPDVADDELMRLHGLGFRGIRFNLAAGTSGLSLDDAPSLAARVAPLGWHLQFHVDLESDARIVDTLARLPGRVVIDHFGRVQGGQHMTSPGPRTLLDLASLGHCWVKLSGVYFVSRQSPWHEDLLELTQGLLQRAPQRLLWGSDWPHVSARARMPDDVDLADALAAWIPDDALRRRVLVDNPSRLYGFD